MEENNIVLKPSSQGGFIESITSYRKCLARTTVAAFLGVAVSVMTSVASATAPTTTDTAIQHIIAERTGRTAQLTDRPVKVAESEITIGVGHDAPAGTRLRSSAQTGGGTSRMISVIDDRRSRSVDFPLGLPEGAEVALHADAGSIVRRLGDERVEVLATIERPWAIDANGRRLHTSYTFGDGVLTQHVDTAGATFPVVTDPSIRTGYHIVPVFYVQYTWTETWWVKNHLPQGAIATALLCSQTGAAAPFCGYYGALFLNDIRVTTDAAIASRKCLKMRLPATTGAIGLPAYDSYYVTCTS